MEYRFKVVIVGPSGSGKSCILKSICNEHIPTSHEVTIGVDYNIKTYLEDNKQYKFCLWDTAGNRTFMPIVKSYFSNSIACLLVFDLTNPNSFSETIEWYEHYTRICPNNTIILLGNKVDKINNSRIQQNDAQLTYGYIGENKIKKFIEDKNILYLETSAITRQNIDDLLHIIQKDSETKILNGEIVPNVNPGLTLHELDNYDQSHRNNNKHNKNNKNKNNKNKNNKNKNENMGCCIIS